MRPSRLAVAADARRAISFLSTVGLWVALAGAALAGPTTTTIPGGTTTTSTTTPTTTTTTGVPTTTTTGVPTTTTTGVPTTTTTGVPTTTTTVVTTTTTTGVPTTTTTGVPTTTTTTTTTTAPPTTTTTTTSSTTTTTLLPNLSGEYPFVDKNLADASQSFLNIDTVAGEMCLAGLVRAIDATVSLNRRVTFSYVTSGPIAKFTDKKVDGVFTLVDLNLDITELRGATDGGPINHYNKTIQLECKVKTSLKQQDGLASVERAKDRVSLDCDLQPGFEAFNADEPFLDEVLISNIDEAYKNQRHVKANSRKGRLKLKSSGSEVFPEDRRNVVPICFLSDPG